LVAVLLDRDHVAGADQQASQQGQRHLRAARDQDVVGRRAQAAARAQHVGQRSAQAGFAHWIAIAKQLGALHERATIGPRQGRARHQARIGDAAEQAERTARQRGGEDDRTRRLEGEARTQEATRAGSRPAWRATSRGERARARVGQLLRHVRAAPVLRVEKAFGQQLAVGGQHGVAVNVQAARQLS
jgi:hypothetical protein